MQIVENWSVVQGRIISVAPATDLNDFSEVEIDLLASEPVEGFPNLMHRDVGHRVSVHVPNNALSPMLIGEHVTLRVRRAGANRVFAALD